MHLAKQEAPWKRGERREEEEQNSSKLWDSIQSSTVPSASQYSRGLPWTHTRRMCNKFLPPPPFARATPLSEQQQVLFPSNFGTLVLLSQGAHQLSPR